ncbi:unnamed protein product [Toxocara canis]|uniref:VWFA domain-containing protein n=1 Tax=Toxocara canis TaxID=6265 RepID=A0A183UI34_TOXCA|nr:unnamed protein product [Toxocara canis]
MGAKAGSCRIAMLGVFMFSTSNELLYAYGNKELLSCMLKNSAMTLTSDHLRSSTSSGVYSDGGSLERGRNSQSDSKEHDGSILSLESSKFVIADSLLPLISIYRASAEVFGDAQQFIESIYFRIVFKPLKDSSLVVTVSEVSINALKRQQQITDMISRLTEFYHGPLLGQTTSAVGFLQLANHRFEQRITVMLDAFSDTNSFGAGSTVRNRTNELDITARVVTAESVEKILSELRILLQELYASMGSICCLLFVSGRFMGFTQADADDVIKYYLPSIAELANFIDLTDVRAHVTIDGRSSSDMELSQASCSRDKTHTETKSVVGSVKIIMHIFKAWMSVGNGKRLLSNVFGIGLSNEIALLWVTVADYSNVLDCLNWLLTKLCVNYLLRNESESLMAIDGKIDRFCTAMKEISADKRVGFDSCSTTFLRNAGTTAQFVKSLWRGIQSELVEATDDHKQISHRKDKHTSMTTLYAMFNRQLWSLALKASTKEHKTQRKQDSHLKRRYYKLDSMLTYFKHHLRNIMLEICMKSFHNAKKFQLPHLAATVRNFFLKRAMDRVAMTLSDLPAHHLRLRKHLHPSVNRLDMIAYTYVQNEQGIRLTFIPGQLMSTSRESGKEACYVLRFSLFSTLVPKRCIRPQKHREHAIQCTAVFDGFVNRELAVRQTTLLADALRGTVQDNSRYLIS